MNRKLDGLKVVADAVAASATTLITSVTSAAQGSAPALTAQVSDCRMGFDIAHTSAPFQTRRHKACSIAKLELALFPVAIWLMAMGPSV